MSSPQHSNQDVDGFVIAPVGIALGAAGVDLRVAPRNRSLSAMSLLENASWRDERIFGRRPGSRRIRLKDSDIYQMAPYAHPGYGNWAYGHGRVHNYEHYPLPGQAKGNFTFGNQALVWTGDRLLGHTDSTRSKWFGSSKFWNRDFTEQDDAHRGIPAYIPTAKLTPRLSNPQGQCGAIGRKYKVIVSVGLPGVAAGVYATVISRVTGQTVHEQVVDADAADSVRVVYSNNRFIVYYYLTIGTLKESSCNEEDYDTWTAPSTVDASADGDYDIAWINENLYIIAWRVGNNVSIVYYTGNVTQPQYAAVPTTLATDEDATGALGVARAINGEIGLVWRTADGTRVQRFDSGGASLGASIVFDVDPCDRCTIAPRFIDIDAPTKSIFVAYAHIPGATDADPSYVKVGAVENAGLDANDTRLYWGANIRTSAWRVGDETFCWLVSNPMAGETVQETYHLIGGAGSGYLAGIARPGDGSLTATTVLCSVMPDPLNEPDESAGIQPTRSRWFHVLASRDDIVLPDDRVRLDMVDLDFLPRLRSARFGGAQYIAGAAVQTWDGRQLVEAGWSQYPQVVTIVPSNGAGAMTNLALYRYRIYGCWKNAAGELFRSPALTSGLLTMGAADDTATVTFTALPFTNKPLNEVYFEIYRTAPGVPAEESTTYYLVGRVNGNTFEDETLTFVDLLSDAVISTGTTAHPTDPHNPAIGAASELEEIAPLGCEIIHAHGDRLWMAGGAIDDGAVSFSKIREQGEGLGWNDLAGTLVLDVSGKRTTSLATLNDSLVAFQDDRILVQPGAGPDNLGNGGFPLPSTLSAADGAINPDGTIIADPGLLFWSRGGPRLLTGSGQVVQIGAPVEPLAKLLTPSGVVAMPGQREIRWYTEDGRALLWDYTQVQEAPQGRWSVWTRLPVAGAAMMNGRPVLALTDGDVLFEDPSLTDDGGAHFDLRFATWEIRPSDLVMGNNRVVQFGLAGLAKGPHTLRCWAYYDGARHWTEYFEWAATDDLELDHVADIDVIVSALVTPGVDGVYRFTRGVRRQPFSTLRLLFSDGGSHEDTFEPHEVALEMGSLNGLVHLRRTYPVTINGDASAPVAFVPGDWTGGMYGP